MLINWADAEVAPAWPRDRAWPKRPSSRANEVIGRADAAHEFDRCRRVADVRTVDLQRVAAEAADFRAHVIENFKEQTDVGNVRHVLDPHTPSTSSVAGRMATAAFFAPEIETAPSSRCPPCTMYFTKSKALFDFIGSTGCNPEDLQCQRAAPE